jgi:hypothetical protein
VLYEAVELASSFFDLQKLTFFGCASRLRVLKLPEKRVELLKKRHERAVFCF